MTRLISKLNELFGPSQQTMAGSTWMHGRLPIVLRGGDHLIVGDMIGGKHFRPEKEQEAIDYVTSLVKPEPEVVA